MARAVNGQRLLQVAENSSIIHDQTADLAGIDPVGPGNGLHQGMVAHGLIQVKRRTARRVKAGHPHGADKNQTEGVLGFLELRLQVFFYHALAVRPDIQALLSHVGNLVLPLRNHHCHIGFFHAGDAVFNLLPGFAIRPGLFRLQSRYLRRPVFFHLVVHADGRGLVDTYHHGLALKATPREMLHQVFGHRLQTGIACDQVVFAGKFALKLLLLGLVQFRLFQQALHVRVEAGVDQLQFRDAVFVVERHRRAVSH